MKLCVCNCTRLYPKTKQKSRGRGTRVALPFFDRYTAGTFELILNLFFMENTAASTPVIIYSTPTCGYCKLAKAFFQEHGVEYVEKDVSVDLQAQEEMINKTNQMGVPVIDINGEIVIGFDQDRLSDLLGIK